VTFSVVTWSKQMSLGSWGTLDLTGAFALLRLKWSDDVEVPESVSQDLLGGVILLNDEKGLLLLLPYESEAVVSYNLRDGKQLHSPVILRRDEDRGLRMATAVVIPGRGAAHLTEFTLSLFQEDCSLAWTREDDFQGWIIKGSTAHELLLLSADWAGHEFHQSRSLQDGRRLSQDQDPPGYEDSRSDV